MATYNIGERVDITATLSMYNSVYIFASDVGETFVWFASADISAGRGDRVQIRGTIKGAREYNGKQQYILSRVTLTAVIVSYIDTKRAEQLASIGAGDHIAVMPYRQYKQHYNDCETLAGSYDNINKNISVIIRAGRMVNSGVRGKHFSGYALISDTGARVTYSAVSAENAIKHAEKDFPGESWELYTIYK